MYTITVGADAKWQECTTTDEELNKAVDLARRNKLLSTLGLSDADLSDLQGFLQQKRDKERAKSSNDGDEEATAAKKQKTDGSSGPAVSADPCKFPGPVSG